MSPTNSIIDNGESISDFEAKETGRVEETKDSVHQEDPSETEQPHKVEDGADQGNGGLQPFAALDSNLSNFILSSRHLHFAGRELTPSAQSLPIVGASQPTQMRSAALNGAARVSNT